MIQQRISQGLDNLKCPRIAGALGPIRNRKCLIPALFLGLGWVGVYIDWCIIILIYSSRSIPGGEG